MHFIIYIIYLFKLFFNNMVLCQYYNYKDNINTFENILNNLLPVQNYSSRPNFIVFLADDVGYGDFSIFGHPTQEYGPIDKMAIEGMRFTQWYSSYSMCTPSRAALLTGRHLIRTGLYGTQRVLNPTDSGGLPDSEITLPEILKPQGYTTGMVGKWHLGINRETYNDGLHLPHHHGFDHVGTLLPYTNVWPCDESKLHVSSANPKSCFLYYGANIIQQPIKLDDLAGRMLYDSIQFVKENSIKKKPYFLYVAFPHAHAAMFSSQRFKNSSRRGRYGDMINEMAWVVNEILDTVKNYDVEDNTLAFFISDNGPHVELCNEGGNPGLLSGGKGNSFEGGFRVPAIAWWPNHIKAGQVSNTVVTTMDIFSTIIELAQTTVPIGPFIDGKSIKNILFGESITSPHKAIFYYCSDIIMAVRFGDFKIHYFTQVKADNLTFQKNCINGIPQRGIYISWECSGEKTQSHNPPLIYNLELDPGEQFPLNYQNYIQMLSDVENIISDHKATITPVPSVLGNIIKSLEPCCDPPKCRCNYD